MQKLISILILLLVIFTLVGCSTSQPNTETIEENIYSGTCPRGLVNDTYPGECAQYIDTNNDNICDRSQ